MQFRARLVGPNGIEGEQTFEADDNSAAWKAANDGVDPITGKWVEVTPVPTQRPAPGFVGQAQEKP